MRLAAASQLGQQGPKGHRWGEISELKLSAVLSVDGLSSDQILII